MDANELINLLELVPHKEGGYFRETYRCSESLQVGALPERYTSVRAVSTCIYYLLTPDTFSALHRLASDEIFHFYLGDPVEMLQLFPDGGSRTIAIGTNLEAGESPQVVIPRGVWQGSYLLPGGRFALIGATVAPGFDFADYEEGRRDILAAQYPDSRVLIERLTRS